MMKSLMTSSLATILALSAWEAHAAQTQLFVTLPDEHIVQPFLVTFSGSSVQSTALNPLLFSELSSPNLIVSNTNTGYICGAEQFGLTGVGYFDLAFPSAGPSGYINLSDPSEPLALAVNDQYLCVALNDKVAVFDPTTANVIANVSLPELCNNGVSLGLNESNLFITNFCSESFPLLAQLPATATITLKQSNPALTQAYGNAVAFGYSNGPLGYFANEAIFEGNDAEGSSIVLVNLNSPMQAIPGLSYFESESLTIPTGIVQAGNNVFMLESYKTNQGAPQPPSRLLTMIPSKGPNSVTFFNLGQIIVGGLATDGAYLYIVDITNSQIVILNAATNQRVGTISVPGGVPSGIIAQRLN